MEPQVQQPIQQPVKLKKKLMKKWWFWLIIIVALVAIGWFSLKTIVHQMGTNNPKGIELQAFGFTFTENYNSNAARITELGLGETKCVFLQGDSEKEITDISIDAVYGSIEVADIYTSTSIIGKEAKAQTTFNQDCRETFVFFDFGPENKNGFAKPFKYIAPDVMPQNSQDTITVTITAKKGLSLTEELTVKLH